LRPPLEIRREKKGRRKQKEEKQTVLEVAIDALTGDWGDQISKRRRGFVEGKGRSLREKREEPGREKGKS